MVRMLALILGVSFCFLSQIACWAETSRDYLPSNTGLARPGLSAQRVILHAKKSDHRQARGASSNSVRDAAQKKEKGSGDQYNSQIQYSSLGSSIFDIRIPGDPRSHSVRGDKNQKESGNTASWSERQKPEETPIPGVILKKLGSLPNPDISIHEKPAQRLEIQVSHSTHVFQLLAHTADPAPQILYQCKIGLGAPEFPTPVGTYYVTHIYDQDPWWIPPPNRAWAAGDSPSRRVYGGTMAPLLKKKTLNPRKKGAPSSEDQIEGIVKLEDYGYRFHGTNAPRSIGRNQSHGCVRMLSDDAKKVALIIEENVGIAERKESENGSYAILKAPVRLNLIK